MKLSGNVILLTGGGSGIGQALARRLHDAGNQVIVTGRRAAALEEAIAGRSGMSARVYDVDDVGATRDFVRQLTREHPRLNVLINNAGIMRSEDLRAERDLADAEAMVQTNLLGPIRLTNALLPQLTRVADAAIVNVTSGLAFVPLASAPTYSATKAAMHSYTVSLRERLAGQVEVIELAPPAVRTELTPGQSTREGYMPLDEYIDETMGLLGRTPTPPEILVERVKLLRNAEAEGRFEQMLGGFRKLWG
jgi:uncharacterized oxidoreductase